MLKLKRRGKTELTSKVFTEKRLAGQTAERCMNMSEFKIDFQLLADGAADGAAGETAKDTVLENENTTGENDVSEKGPDAGDGKAPETITTSDTLDAKRAEFEKLISGDYKELFSERVQNIINKRFRDDRARREIIEKQQPIIDLLCQKYGIEDGDTEKLRAAFESDNTYWEEAAENAGMGVEQYRELTRLRAETARLRAERESAEADSFVNRQLTQWFSEGEGLKELYPGFDMRAEMENRDFLGLLKAGIPVRKAYELLHMDEILNGAAESAAKETERRVVDDIRKKQARPDENGLKNTNGAVLKKSVASLTREERAELARRAQRGEKITF